MNSTVLRHRLLLTGSAALLAVTLTACGSSEADDSSQSSSSGGELLSDDAFPRTVETIRGDIEIESAPERIVVLDSQSVDVVASLGLATAAYDLGANDDAKVLPWLDGEVEGEFVPGLVGADNAIDYEEVLAADPDLIIVDHWVGAEGEAFDRLNEIAPTLTNDVDSAVSWQDRTTFIADALGLEDEGEQLIDDTEASIDEATADLEALDGESYYYLGFSQEQGGLWYGNGTWLQDFGLEPGKGQDNSHADFEVVSLENVTDFDSDVIAVWPMTDSDKTALEKDSRFQKLPAVEAGKVIWLDFALATATNVPGPKSVLYTVDEVAPLLQDAVER